MSEFKESPLLNPHDPADSAAGNQFYGWWIVLASTAILFVSSGIGFYGHGVILDPLSSQHGWSKATISSAVTLYFITSGINQFPDGVPPQARVEQSTASAISYSAQMRVWTRRQAMGTITFWSIVIAFLLALAGQIAFLMHQISFLSQYLGVSGAATAVSVTAGASIVGRLWLGTFVDRCDNRYVTMVGFLIQGVAMLTLAHYQHVAILYLGTLTFGLTMGSIIMMQSLITGECFGLVSFATVSGLGGVFTMTGAAFGPSIAGFIFDATSSYRMSFTIFAAMSAVAILAIYFAKPPKAQTT